jgi:acyl-CoA thioesterase FadM
MLRTTHTSSVTEDQIDHLGHMNVRYYAVNANAATRAVLADLPGWDSRPYVVHDIYTRHHREQMLGTDLEVRSAILGADDQDLRIHHELAAVGTGVLAATFVHRLSPLASDGRRAPLPPAVLAAAVDQVGPTPEHFGTRTISLDCDLMAVTPSLETVLERNLAMRKPRRVSADECDADGRYRIEMIPALTWGGEPLAGDMSDILHETDDGKLMGWASMETRVQVGQMPTVGDRIQSFGATVALHDKVTHRVHWAFDLDSGALLNAFESVSMAFDIRGRRPMSIPERYRERDEQRIQADLAPQATAG